MREVVAEVSNPVMLYSIGKDSAVMLHLAKKAFYPSPPPFSLLHVDTTWKFQEMYELRGKAAQDAGMDLIVYQNPYAKARSGELKHFTGIDSPYEKPINPEIYIDTTKLSPEEAAEKIIKYLLNR